MAKGRGQRMSPILPLQFLYKNRRSGIGHVSPASESVYVDALSHWQISCSGTSCYTVSSMWTPKCDIAHHRHLDMSEYTSVCLQLSGLHYHTLKVLRVSTWVYYFIVPVSVLLMPGKMKVEFGHQIHHILLKKPFDPSVEVAGRLESV